MLRFLLWVPKSGNQFLGVLVAVYLWLHVCSFLCNGSQGKVGQGEGRRHILARTGELRQDQTGTVVFREEGMAVEAGGQSYETGMGPGPTFSLDTGHWGSL